MAATTGVLNSTDLRVYSEGSVIACATDASLSMNLDLRETTCKDSGGFQEFKPGVRSGTLTTTALLIQEATYGIEQLMDAYLNDTEPIRVAFKTATAENLDWYSDAWIQSIEVNSAGTDDNVSYSVTFQLVGQLEFSASS